MTAGWHTLGVLAPVVVVLGVATAIGGGLLRDVLAGRPTLLMSRELYATPVLLGCTLYVLAAIAIPRTAWLALAAMAVIFVLRAVAIRFELTMPDVLVMQNERASSVERAHGIVADEYFKEHS